MTISHAVRRLTPRFVLVSLVLLVLGPALQAAPGAAQEPSPDRDRLTVTRMEGPAQVLPLVRHRGFPALSWSVLESLGWTLEESGGGGGDYTAVLGKESRITLRPDLPFVRVGEGWAQLVQAPYLRDGTLFVPLQLLTDVLPDRLPGLYRARDGRTLAVLSGSDAPGTGAPAEVGGPGGEKSTAVPSPSEKVDPTRVVVIDAGHGGRDPGALGPGRTREKDVTLAVARALAEALSGEPDVEVHLTRDDDTLVPLWQRGEIATRFKGDRYGVFLSIHANSVTRRDIRGVETYFLSEARTEHEARVAALENSAMELERDGGAGPGADELSLLFSDLLNSDFQRWSATLAELTQGELAAMHPGPNRGVKQGPLAVLTNAMMPSVLVEVGFITHPDEEDLLGREDFHREVADALARAVLDFFQRYPPGQPRRADGA